MLKLASTLLSTSINTIIVVVASYYCTQCGMTQGDSVETLGFRNILIRNLDSRLTVTSVEATLDVEA